MKKIKVLLPLLLMFALVSNGFSQKIKVTSGKLSNLAGITDVNAVFDFSSFAVGKFKKEADYIKERSGKMNKKEPGTGDEWIKKWNDDKTEKYQRKFDELYGKYSETSKITDKPSDIKMIVKTTFIEPGFNVGVTRKPAKVNMNVTFKKGDEELVTLTVTGAPGNGAAGYDFDTSLRIQESYAKAGKEVAQYLVKHVK